MVFLRYKFLLHITKGEKNITGFYSPLKIESYPWRS